MAGMAIKVGADTRPFEAGMKAAVSVGAQTAAQIGAKWAATATGIDRAMAQTARNVGVTFGREVAAKITPAALGIAGAVAGFVAIQHAVHEVGEAAEAARKRLEALVKIGADARGAGVSTTFLQSLTGQAKALNTEVSTLTGMLETAREASTVRIGEGDGDATSTILNRLRQNAKAGNIGQVDLDRFTNADSQEARIRVILDLIDQLRAKGAQLAALDLARTMFGAEFENKLRTGTDMIGAMRRALDGLAAGDRGRIIPPEEIQRAENLNRRLEEAKRVLETGLAPINRDIALWQSQQLASWVDIKEQIAAAAAQAGKLYEWVTGVGKVLSDLGNSNVFKTLRDAMDRMGLIDQGEVARINRMLNGGLEATDNPTVPKDGAPLQISVRPKTDTSRALPSLSKPRASSAPSQSEISAIESFVGQLEKSAAALKAEADAYGLSNAERRIAIELAKAEEIAKQNGIKLTEEQTKRIREAATAMAEQRDKLDDLRDKQELLRGTGSDVFRGFYNDARNGASALDSLNNALGRVLDRIANAQIDGLIDSLFGKGGTSGALSGLLGGGKSSGVGLGDILGFFTGSVSPLPKYADGAILRGPGTGTSDSMLARVSTGEAIIPARVVAQNRPVVEALVRDRLPRFADGLMPDLGALTAGSLASQETAMRAMPTPNLGPDHKPGFNTDITIKGGEKTGVESSMGPRGPRMEITLDKMVASMLLGGPDTRAALKKLGSGNLTGR